MKTVEAFLSEARNQIHAENAQAAQAWAELAQYVSQYVPEPINQLIELPDAITGRPEGTAALPIQVNGRLDVMSVTVHFAERWWEIDGEKAFLVNFEPVPNEAGDIYLTESKWFKLSDVGPAFVLAWDTTETIAQMKAVFFDAEDPGQTWGNDMQQALTEARNRDEILKIIAAILIRIAEGGR